MKVYSKQTREAFNDRAAAILSPFSEYPEGFCGYTHRCMSDIGIISIMISPLEHGDTCADVCTRVEDTKHPGIERFDISLPSGKWDVVDFQSDRCLDTFERRLRSINARPPTKDEAIAWQKSDEATLEERQNLRDGWESLA